MQIICNSLVTAAGYLLIALGFALILRTCRFLHFAHGAVFTAGAYSAFLYRTVLGMPLLHSALLAVVCCAALGCLMETCVYRVLRRSRASSLTLLLASLGIYVLLQNIVSLIFGDDTKTIRAGAVEEGLRILGARITQVQVMTVFTCLLLTFLTVVLLTKSRVGKALRAVAGDPELAETSGVESEKVILWAFALGSASVGIAGVLYALDVDMTPTMGMRPLMMAVVAVIVGGVGSVPGLVLGALLLGIAQHLGAWLIGSQWQDSIAFFILLGFLLFRPQGFLGREVRKATV